MDKLRVGIIGLGGIAFNKHMPSLGKLPQVELAGFFDIDAARSRRAKQEFGSPSAAVYDDYRKLLEDPAIDVVHICTPNDSHAEISIAALQAGKHVMCEKPMAITVESARAMVKTARDTGRKLTIGYNYRFRPDAWYLKKYCRSGELGDIYLAKAMAVRRRGVPTWGVFLDKAKQGGGPLIDIGTHALDMALWLMDNYEPASVTGSVFRKLAAQGSEANAWGNWDPAKMTVEDSAFGYIKMKNGATIMLESGWAINMLTSDHVKTTLCGTLGGADMEDGLRINGEKNGSLYEMKLGLGKGGVSFYDGNRESANDKEARLWIESILNDREPVVTPEQALVVTEILDAIYTSSETGKTVYFA